MTPGAVGLSGMLSGTFNRSTHQFFQTHAVSCTHSLMHLSLSLPTFPGSQPVRCSNPSGTYP